MPWSEQQLKAINTTGKNILVAAAAGSGKTSVLVERIIQHIVSGRCDINEILVVTFTNAAAAEMRGRIASAITEKLSDEAKERQLVLLNAASISTLHSFCQNLIRQNFHELGLDPKFRLAGEQETALLKLDVLEELFESAYDAPDNEAFLRFADLYGSERGDDAAYDIILKLYEYSRSQPFPKQWLESLPLRFDAGGDIEHSPWIELLLQKAKDELSSCRETALQLHRLTENQQCEPLAKTAESDIAALGTCLACDSWQALQAALTDISFARMSPSKKIPEDLKDEFRRRRDEMKSTVKKLRENYFEQPLDDAAADLPVLRSDAAALCRITLDFAAAFARAKAEKSLLDFSDLEHFALDLLAAPGSDADNLIPTAAAAALQAKYKEIMVDEYQDTNGVQEAIIRLIASRKSPNCFFVGDVKQSIYKFRLAEPELFLHKYNTYPLDESCMRIDLSQNFRSRREIIDAVNFIFSQIMTVKAAELPYGEAEALRCGLEYPPAPQLHTLESPVELTVIDKKNLHADSDAADGSSEGFKAEAAFIVQRIKELMSVHPLVYDKNSKAYRPLKWRDIVVLTRTVKEKGQILSDAMRAAAIPVYSGDETGYFQAAEIRVMVSLLQIIDNPQQDIPLAAVLYSPIVNMTAEDLARIRLLSPKTPLYKALEAAAGGEHRLKRELVQKAASFLADLEKWRGYARCHSVPELIWKLLDETGYYDYAGGMREGLVRQANLRALYDRAAAYEQTSFRGLFRFLRFIKRMKDIGSDLEAARSLGEGEDVVRIMSIHKSKGLEFPVVIIADAGKRFNLKDAQQEPVLMHKRLGLGLYACDTENHIRYQTLPRQAIAAQITHELKAEEMRTLYVAMTRAREKLIIVGSVSDADKFAARCCSDLPEEGHALPDHFIESAGSYLDWLGAALARHKSGRALRSGAESVRLLPDESRWQINILSSIDAVQSPEETEDARQMLQAVQKLKHLPPSGDAAWVNARLSWHYPHTEESAVPAKLSVTEIKRRFAEESAELDGSAAYIEDASFRRPRFLQQSTSMTNTEFGTLMHTIMQHLDLHGDLTDKGILKQTERMAEDEIIDRADIRKVYRKNIRDFLYSPLGCRLRSAEHIERELSFSRMVSTAEINRLSPSENAYPDTGQSVFIQGTIDLLFQENGRLVLIDYKTDRCSGDEARQRYAVQIELYAAAARSILNMPVAEKYIYMFHSGTVVNMAEP